VRSEDAEVLVGGDTDGLGMSGRLMQSRYVFQCRLNAGTILSMHFHDSGKLQHRSVTSLLTTLFVPVEQSVGCVCAP